MGVKMSRKTLLFTSFCIFILALLLVAPVSASTTTYVNDTFSDESGIESSTNETGSSGNVTNTVVTLTEIIKDLSFETPIGAENWTYSETHANFSGQRTTNFYHFYSSGDMPNGEYAYEIYVPAHTTTNVDEFANLSQSVDWTGVNVLLFNINYQAVETHRISVYIGSTEIYYLQPGVGGASGNSLITKDVSGFQGVQDLKFTFKSETTTSSSIDVGFVIDYVRPRGYAPLSTLTSTTNTTSTHILNVTPTITNTTPAGTSITYNCSNDDGTTWESVSDGTLHTFSSVGKQFKWRANLTTTNASLTPLISDVSFLLKTNSLPNTSSIDIQGVQEILHITNHTPDITWTYSDDDGHTQDQYNTTVWTGTGGTGTLMGTSGDVSSALTTWMYSGTALVDGTTYYARVSTNDSYEWGSWNETTFKMNSFPSVSNITVSPTLPTTFDDLTVTNDTATDAESDSITLYYTWYINGTLNSTFNDTTEINSSYTSAGEIWKCGIVPNDGYENGTEEFSNEVEIESGNSAPSAPTNLSPITRQIGNSVNLMWNQSIDAENDSITYYWYVEENTETFGSPYFASGSGSGNYSGAINTTDGKTYYYRVKAYDGSLHSGFTSIANFTENTLPSGLLIPGSTGYEISQVAQFTAIFIDAESDNLTYNFSANGGISWDSTDSTNTWSHTFYTLGVKIVTVEVSDGYETVQKTTSVHISTSGDGAGDGVVSPVPDEDEVEPIHPMFNWLVLIGMAIIASVLLGNIKLAIVLAVFFLYLYLAGVGMV